MEQEQRLSWSPAPLQSSQRCPQFTLLRWPLQHTWDGKWIFLQNKAGGVSIFLGFFHGASEMESRKYLAGMPGREGRESTRGGLGQGLDLGTGREGNGEEGLPAAAGAAREQEIEEIRGEEGGAKAEGDKSDVAVVGRGHLRL